VRTIAANDIHVLIITALISALVGGSGICGVAFLFVRRYIEKRLEEKEQVDKNRILQRKKRLEAEDRLQHGAGRLFFWMHKAIVTGEHNGDLEAAFNEYQAAERELKDLNREIVVENEMKE